MSRHTSRWLGLTCLLTSIVLSALGQLGMKAGLPRVATRRNYRGFRADGRHARCAAAGYALAAGGLATHGPSMLAWLVVLVRYRLSYAYPLLGVSYVHVYVGATQWSRLLEPVTTARTVGTVVLILAGVALVALSHDKAGA